MLDSIKTWFAGGCLLTIAIMAAAIKIICKGWKKDKAEIENLKRNAKTEKIHHEIITDLDLQREQDLDKYNEMVIKQKVNFEQMKLEEANENRNNRRITDNIISLLNNPNDKDA
jgi:outer membrane receptor for monomeric catechols